MAWRQKAGYDFELILAVEKLSGLNHAVKVSFVEGTKCTIEKQYDGHFVGIDGLNLGSIQIIVRAVLFRPVVFYDITPD